MESKEQNPADNLMQTDQKISIWKTAQAVLNQAQFTAIWLKYCNNMKVSEIAKVLDKTPSHTKVILYRARAILAEKLNNQPQIIDNWG